MTVEKPGTLPPPPPREQRPSYPSYVPYPNSSHPYLAPVSQTTAVWALVLSIVPIPVGWLVSIGLAISVLSQSRDGRGRERGRGMAIAALVIAPLWIATVIALVATGDLESSAERSTKGTVSSRGDARVDSLRVGDCLAKMPRETAFARTVELVPCSEKHAGEVYANFDLAAGAYPGKAQVERLAEGGCVRRFDDHFGQKASAAQLGVFFYLPLEARWSIDRGVTCIAVEDGPGSEIADEPTSGA